ncbi:hypothetical protein [Paludisphaera soli]|uniref:hypothetical protein n=1 Tax=Paludisphaera soli TaxID=2712865 RepID=UPI0013EDD5E2|nr:hypothetical protein [Paludisphaera soli]
MKPFPFNPAWAMDPRVQSMPEAFQRRHVMILCYQAIDGLAGFRNADLAASLRISPDVLAETKAALLERGLIGDDWRPNGFPTIGGEDEAERQKRLAAERQKRRRERLKSTAVTGCNVTDHVTRHVTSRVTENVTKRDVTRDAVTPPNPPPK